MGFYLRKSVRVGALRFNLSKSGIGVSAGIPGFRVGTGPRGNYVHVGRGGLYYRASLGGKQGTPAHPVSSTQGPEMIEICTADVSQFQDANSTDLIDELNKKAGYETLRNIAVLVSVIAGIVLLFSVSSQNPLMLVWAIAVGVLGPVIAQFIYRTISATVLLYDLDENVENAYQELHTAFDELKSCNKAWTVTSQAHLSDPTERRRNSNVSSIVSRSITILSTNSTAPIQTNIEVPAIINGYRSMWFYPDRILIKSKGQYGAISYSDVYVAAYWQNFVEEMTAVPSDATITSKTWRFPRKDGGPDLRFSNNREMAVCRYSEMRFEVQDNTLLLVQFSRDEVGDAFKAAVVGMAQVSKETEKIEAEPVANL